MNYRETLNLPKTSFPMRASLTQREPEMVKFWEQVDLYNLLRQKRQGKDKYILHDGPPYANGLIHIGHALNKILKDIIVKFKFLNGFDSPFVVGWDCHGLPVEHQLFKELKQTKHDVDTLIFRKKARNYALKFVKLQTKDFKRLGIFADWDNPYLTLDPNYESEVIELLKDLALAGYIYRGRKPVNWCINCETALAEAEVEYQDKSSESLYFLFKAKELKKEIIASVNQEIYFCVWTTTPWTVVSNVAVALHPDFDYLLVQYQDKLIILAKKLREKLEEKLGEKLKEIGVVKGRDLEGSILNHPFIERNSPVVLADFISAEEGTGCVHIAPGHGQEDFSLQKKYNLEVIMPVGQDGRFLEPFDFKGKDLSQANQLVINKLKDTGKIILLEKLNHSYPHCWRCRSPVIFRATHQWFFNIDHQGLRKKLLSVVETLSWVPASGKQRMRAMIESRPDWCLSRQRLWGAPIPALKCRGCQLVFLSPQVLAKAALVFKNKGSDAWFKEPLELFLPEGFSCPGCKEKVFIKEFDILDVWFESGASFRAVLAASGHLNFPADLYLEGNDQHRGWFQVSMIPSVASSQEAPFKTVLTHGFVVDGEGKKMSKSLGNVISPQDIAQKYGAEVLRLWAAYSDYRQDIRISEEIIKQLSDLYRKIRNTIRFILGNLYDFEPKKSNFSFSELTEIDQYMLSKTMVFFQETIKLYDSFSFYKVCQNIFYFCNQELSSFYLDILKDRLYTHSAASGVRRSSQFVLSKVLMILLKLAAPILSFTAEEAYSCWERDDKDTSIFISELSSLYDPSLIDNKLLSKWSKLIALRQQVLREIEAKREENFIGSSLEARVILFAEGNDLLFYQQNKDLLTEIFIVSEVSLESGPFKVNVEKAEGKKCIRCWNWRETVGKNKDFPQICSRCFEAIKEERDEEKGC